MAKFIVTEEFWTIFPEAEIAVVLAKGIDNSKDGTKSVRSDIIELLGSSNEAARRFLTASVLSENPVIAVWRKAFQQFKTKKGVRCSIEALLKRIDKGACVGPINPLVDLYNSVSLEFGLPCGGEDIDTFEGDLLLTKATGEELFLALGDEEYDNALPGEIIYRDDAGAVCRCWNWRDGQRTMLTENTVNAFLIIESVDPARHGDLQTAAEALAGRVRHFLGGATSIHDVNRRQPQIDL